MEQQDKDLMMRDLCSHLPYGVRVEYQGEMNSTIYDVLGLAHGRVVLCLPFMSNTSCPLVEEVKPYLFPMSSMTEEQEREIVSITYSNHNDMVIASLTIDWLNKNHFDYRGLIDKGLAIDATGLNIY